MKEPSVKDDGSESGDQAQESTHEAPITVRPEFYEAFKRQAEIFDKDLNEYNKELNVTLLFAVLFAVVTSTFLTLEESKRLLLAWDSRQAASTISTIVSCSLAASLLAAVLAIFAKQSLKRCAIMDFDAADLNNGRYRAPSAFHRLVPKIFTFVIEGLSLVLQAALLVVSCTLANYLWTKDQWAASLTVAGVEILCIALITSATIGPALFGVSGGAVTKSIRKPLLQALVSTKPSVKNFRRRILPKRRPSELTSGDGSLEKVEIISADDVPIIFERQPIDWSGFVSDSLCIGWMFDRSPDSDEAAVILDFTTEVVWHSAICEVPLANIFEIFDKCFHHSDGKPTLIPRLRDRAYKAGRALAHLGIQRKCIGEEKDDPLEGLRGMRGSYSAHSYDNDLDSILNIVDRLFGNPRPIDWTGFTFSESHQRWSSHIFLYRAWDHLCYTSKLPDDVKAFVTHAFSTEGIHPAVVADCLFIVSLVIGIPLHVDDLAVDDKSSESEALYARIFSKLESTFNTHAVREYTRSIDAMRLIAPLGNETIAQGCYSLFHVILSSSFEKEKIWEAARFAIHGAYSWDTYLPWIEDPDDIIKFLAHHFAIQAEGEDGVAAQPIEDVLRAVAYSSNETTLEGLKKFDYTNKLFVSGIRKALEEDRSFETRKATLFLMPIIQDKWFDDSLEDIMSEEERGEFCKNWGSAVDGIEHTADVKKATCETFFAMLNSKKWRSHIVKDKLKLMEYFADLPDTSKSLTACKKNASVLPWLRPVRTEEAGEEGSEETKLWKLWVAILWSDYANLSKDVRDQVLELTMGVISKARHDVGFISRIMAAEKERHQTKLDEHEVCSLEDEAERLRTKVEEMNEGIEKFEDVIGKKARQ